MRANQDTQQTKRDVMSVFHVLPRDLSQEMLAKAEAYKLRVNAAKPEGEKDMTLRDALESVLSIMFYKPLWAKRYYVRVDTNNFGVEPGRYVMMQVGEGE